MRILEKKQPTLTSRLCKPLLVLGLGYLAHSAAPGYPIGSENTIKSCQEALKSHFRNICLPRPTELVVIILNHVYDPVWHVIMCLGDKCLTNRN